MKRYFRKSISLMSAAALTIAACTPLLTTVSAETSETTDVTAVARELGTYEAEELDIGTQPVWTSVYKDEVPGYSGSGFIYLTNEKFSITVNVEEEGMYSISGRCAQFLSSVDGTTKESRMQTLSINGIKYTFDMPYMREWTDFDFGVFRLKKGENVIEFLPQYGYACYDTITVEKAVLPELKGTGVTCDPDATPEAKSLLSYLNGVYGKHVLSGQQEIYGGGHPVDTTIRYDKDTNTCVDADGKTYTFDESEKDTADDGSTFVWHCYDENGQEYTYNAQNRNYKYNNYNQEMEYLHDLTGKYPAVRGFDFGSNCPCYAWDDGVTKRMIDWAKNKGGICTASWHINVPTNMADYTLGEPLDFSKTTYTEKTNFVTANVMVEGTVEYEYFKLCMENIAKQLLELQEAGVPVLFRPWHEAEGNGPNGGAWFWWAKEGAEVYKELWKYFYDTMTNEYGIHNLIWEQNLYAWSEASADWYVGDDYVDIVGFDKYDTVYNRHDGLTSGPNEDCNSKVFWSLVNYVDNKKMIAMTENSTIPSITNMLVEKANWLYFCTWYDDNGSNNFISGADFNNADTVTETYQSEYCITLDELPADLYTGASEPSTEPSTGGTTSGTEGLPGDADLDGKVGISDVVKVMMYVANKEENTLTGVALDNADVFSRGDGVFISDALSIQKKVAQIIDTLPESFNE